MALLPCAILGGCLATSTPAILVLPDGKVLRGSASSLVGGQFFVRNERSSCYGSFETKVAGVSLTPTRKIAAVTATCDGGLRGTSGEDLAQNGRAELDFGRGRRGSLAIGGAATGS